MQLTIEHIKNNGWLIFEAIAGSKAYGLDTPASDTDIKGVFVLPKNMFYGLEYTAQVNNETNDIVYYELKRFVELLVKNNPNMLELLCTPNERVLLKHPVMELLQPELLVSKLCEQSFANYAFTQIKKAYGLEKKIMRPMEDKRKSILDFCFVHQEKEAVPLKTFLNENNIVQEKLGLSSITHVRDCYNLYYSGAGNYAGIMRKEEANDICLSSIPKEEKPIGMLYFNKDGYSVYCKQYNEYQTWVSKRNEQRYNTTIAHGKKYDSKNMMHVFRLLLVAKEIATERKVNVFRKDREFLLAIKEGKFEYDELVQRATTLKDELPLLYQQSNLINEPDLKLVEQILVRMRQEYYALIKAE
jgi:uncharacterized protein